MPRPAVPTVRAPRRVVATLLVAAAGAGVAGCSTSAPARLDPPAGATALLTPTAAPTGVLPSTDPSAGTVGALAEGFPADLVPVPEGAEVLVSSAQPVEGTDLTSISLNLRSPADVAALVAALRDPLLAAGFTETSTAPPAGLAAQSTFARSEGGELLVLGVVDDGDTRTATLGGTVRATGT
ncbi:hypothetical protein [Cellulomonas marina]|uniref:hypothetical protein n=1 Tax=Cellulomonas marina TaxID=988821 RepID=UPI001EF376FF|nr:hypothetical protein [Cellulomonas marina]